jgi:hypothetical protein
VSRKNAPEWTKPYIALQYDDGTWYVPWHGRGYALQHRADVEKTFKIRLQIVPGAEPDEWHVTT